jgi:hypothetical protein
MSIFVVSKMANDVKYTTWQTMRDGANNIKNRIVREIIIKGGVGVVNSKTLIAPDGRGVFTEISEEDKEFLMNNPVFKRQLEKGYVSIVGNEKSNIGEKLQADDNSAQLTEEDFSEEANYANINDTDLKIGDKKVKADKPKRSTKRKR